MRFCEQVDADQNMVLIVNILFYEQVCHDLSVMPMLNKTNHASCFFSSVLTFPRELVSFTLICCARLTISALF